MTVSCCIAGGGPAGVMLGLLLARAGIGITVLEKHADFLRDFRGDTIHPSTLELMAELDLLDAFLKLPHQEADRITAEVGEKALTVADFRSLPTRCKFIAFMPQWDFLNFLADRASRYPGFDLRMQAEARNLIEESGRTVGVMAETPDGPLEIHADLIVAADGRSSTIRKAAGLPVDDIGAPIDVLWFRLPRQADDPSGPTGRFDAGRITVRIDRGDYWQCAVVIKKGSFGQVREQGLDDFRRRLADMLPFARERVATITSWDEVKLLTVQVDRLQNWCKPNLLCIGDAAHAMSPVGGVGINLAIQDAVAAANLLFEPLGSGNLALDHLKAVQRRREMPTRVTQWLQVQAQKRVLEAVLASDAPLRPPLPLRLLDRWPILRRLPARLVGLGIRPEHIQSPDVHHDSVHQQDVVTP